MSFSRLGIVPSAVLWRIIIQPVERALHKNASSNVHDCSYSSEFENRQNNNPVSLLNGTFLNGLMARACINNEKDGSDAEIKWALKLTSVCSGTDAVGDT